MFSVTEEDPDPDDADVSLGAPSHRNPCEDLRHGSLAPTGGGTEMCRLLVQNQEWSGKTSGHRIQEFEV